jgi:steroid 5-alpha reductase family enzyme
MKEKIEKNKELIAYAVILLFLIIIVICNNVFWKIGKETETTNNIDYLESNNVIYDVPYEEKVLD